MSEKEIKLKEIDPVDIFGINNTNFQLIKTYFPKLKIVARGDLIKLIGDKHEISRFEHKFNLLLDHYSHYGRLTENDVSQIFDKGRVEMPDVSQEFGDVLVHGREGMLIKPQTPNQKRMVKSFEEHDLIFVIGPAGTGKTYTAVALAVRALKNKEVKRIIITRPAVEAGENLGFLPGDLREKLDPYMQPLYDALRDMIPPAKLAAYIEDGTIEIAPLAYMRGRTLNNVFAILDEAQNATESQLKMFLTRMGKTAKFIVTGDVTQVDLPKASHSGLIHASKILKDISGIDIVYLDERDIIRHKLVTKIVDAYQRNEQ
jgi:phosphate starvation-inducible protein PhoH and related proteins